MFFTTDEPPYRRFKPLEEHWKMMLAEVPPFKIETVTLKREMGEWADTANGRELFEKLQSNTNWIKGWDEAWFNFPLIFNDTVMGKADWLCPKTVALLKSVGGINIAGFSILLPKSTLSLHTDTTGPTTNSIAFNMKLSGSNSKLYVKNGEGFARHAHRHGEAVLFNSEIEHYATNDGPTNRVILYVDAKVESPASS